MNWVCCIFVVCYVYLVNCIILGHNKKSSIFVSKTLMYASKLKLKIIYHMKY